MKKKMPEEPIEIEEAKPEDTLPIVEEVTEEPKADDTYDRLVRVTADYENFRKRTQKEKAELIRYGNENLLREVLPVLDNFERAVEHAQKSADVESIRTGVELILSQLKTTLDRFGLTTQPSVGEPFDPLVHEAVNHIPSDEFPPNTVMNEHQKAYFLNSRLLRPALVTVSKGEEAAPEATKDAGEPQDSVSDEKKE
ncbi:MAG: nucleotide exchange factor GrpE [Pseudomonadota bacterium]